VTYAELHCKTNYSFLEGGSHADELVAAASRQSYCALAVTDRDSLAGIVRSHVAAKEAGLKLIVGAELRLSDAPAAVVWTPDRHAYGRLCRMITLGRRRAEKGSCDLSFADLADHAGGLLVGVIPNVASDSGAALGLYRDLFGDRAYLLAELFCGPDDDRRLEQLQRLSRHFGMPLVAANDVHYHAPARRPLHDVLTAKGITFVTLEDEAGAINLIVHQSTWERYYAIARRSPVWLAYGTLERKEAIIHIIAQRLVDISDRIGELRSPSRDFR
jgi:error-prone DNA polymerase